jgi:hypothetical protein
MNMVFQGHEDANPGPPAVPEMLDIRVRRCVSADSLTTTTGHSQGIICIGVAGLLVEECLFDQNGWGPDGTLNPVMVFGSNLYLHISCTGVTTRRNIVARGAGMGLMQRAGGVCEENLCIENPVNINFGYNSVPLYVTGSIARNVIVGSRDIDGANPRGGGISLTYTTGLSVNGNVIAHQGAGTGNVIAIDFAPTCAGATVIGNVVYDWQTSVPAGANQDRGVCLRVHTAPVSGSIVCMANEFQQPGDGFVAGVDPFPPPPEVRFSGNRYWSDGNYFYALSGAQWVAASGEGPDAMQARGYPDGARDISSYAASQGIGGGAGGLLMQARQQSRDNWNEALTASAIGSYIRAGFVVPCYADCNADRLVNIGDATCFLQRYVAGDPWANCDGSGLPPAVNVADFTCFLQKYTQGCN